MQHRNGPGRAQGRLESLVGRIGAGLALALCSGIAAAAGEPPAVLGIPVDFILFAATLLGVALFHRHTLYVALIGGAVAATVFRRKVHIGHLAAIGTNVTVNLKFKHLADHFPFIGVAVWVAILVCTPLRKPEWKLVPEAFKGSIFLLSLIVCASMMPVEKLPPASWQSSFALGFISSVFDNIPLTALALKQGGYDWGMLAYAVGFGGSMIWFGSSAGVALSNMYPEANNVGRWLYHGWHVAIASVVGFFVMCAIMGWQPNERHKAGLEAAPAASALAAAGTQHGRTHAIPRTQQARG